jgi:NAD/NADP transhydrogenase beta subunit
VNESYNGVTTQKTFTPTSITATNSYSGWNATATSLTLPNMANGTDSVDLSITGSVVDSENTTRLVFGNIGW